MAQHPGNLASLRPLASARITNRFADTVDFARNLITQGFRAVSAAGFLRSDPDAGRAGRYVPRRRIPARGTDLSMPKQRTSVSGEAAAWSGERND